MINNTNNNYKEFFGIIIDASTPSLIEKSNIYSTKIKIIDETINYNKKL
jgi:hypothetical protein